MIYHADALAWLRDAPTSMVDLILTDPPYYGIVKDSWDNQWPDVEAYSLWLASIWRECYRILAPHGSLLFFHCVGRHGEHPIFRAVLDAEACGLTYRNWLTWRKRRAYGKSHDYLFIREEILWFSKSSDRTVVTFNKPYTAEKRGYAGFDPKYPALSEYKRVGNVLDYDDTIIAEPELMRPKRACQKPESLLTRLIETHSNPGQLIVDPFAGYGSTGIAAIKLGRQFVGCEAIEEDALAANARLCATL